MLRFGTKALTVAALSLALSGLSGAAWAEGDAAAGEAKAKGCISCHPADGDENKGPSLVGADVEEFAEMMNGYKSGELDHTLMKMLAKKLSDQDIANLAAYYESLE